MNSLMEQSVGPEALAKIKAIVASHPEGIMPEQIKEQYGFANMDAIRAALHVLEDRGEVQAVDPIYGYRIMTASELLARAEAARGETPKCKYCGKPATLFPIAEDGVADPTCAECSNKFPVI